MQCVLQIEEAEHDVHARPFKLPGPAHIVRLVEAGFQLDQRGHVFPVFGGLNQRPRDGRIAARAIERLLDGQHAWVVRRPADEIDDRIECIVGMVQQDIALRNQRKEIVAPPPNAARQLRRKRRIAKMIAVGDLRQLHQCRQIERPGDAIDFAIALGRTVADRFVVDDHPRQLLAAAGRHLEPHRLAALAGLEPIFNQPQHVVRFLFEQFDVAVARDPERRPRKNIEAAEQFRQPRGDRLFEQDELLAVALPERHEPRQHLRHLHDGEQLLRPQAAAALEHRRQIETAIVIPRTRMRRIDGHRRKNRKRAVTKEDVEGLMLTGGQVFHAQQSNPFRGKLRQHRFVPASILRGDEFLRAFRDPLQLRDGSHAVRGEILRSAVAERLLAQARRRGP